MQKNFFYLWKIVLLIMLVERELLNYYGEKHGYLYLEKKKNLEMVEEIKIRE